MVKFLEVVGVTNFKPFSLGKYERRFATKNPPSFSRGGGGLKCKISSPKSSGSGFAQQLERHSPKDISVAAALMETQADSTHT